MTTDHYCSYYYNLWYDRGAYSWVSRDVINFLGINSKSIHSHWKEILFHCMCWSFLAANMYNLVRFVHSGTCNYQYILGTGWPPLRFTAKCPSKTQEYCITNLSGNGSLKWITPATGPHVLYVANIWSRKGDLPNLKDLRNLVAPWL